MIFQIDTLIPKTSWSEFLFKGSDSDKEKVRLRSIKLRGQVSQGLLVPIDAICDMEGINEVISDLLHNRTDVVGYDVTDLLGVEKYEKPIPANLAGEVEGDFPTHLLSKTDEERIQNLPDMLDKVKGKLVYVSVKHDGTSATYAKDKDGKEYVCSRNLSLRKTEKNTFWKIVEKYDIFNKLPNNCAIQGEIIGEGIQKNNEELKGQDIRVFNVINLEDRSLLDYKQFKKICADMEIPTVDEYYIGEFKWNTIDELLELADQVKYKSGRQAEGLVFRLLENEIDSTTGKEVSFKVISNRYALKHGE